MRREIVLPAALLALLGAALAWGAWAILVPSAPGWLLPAGAIVTQVDQVGLGRQRIAVRMGQRQSRYAIYEHLTRSGWQLRRVNVTREDSDQLFVRRSLADNMLEVALLVPAGTGRDDVIIFYQRCFRQITCGIR